jgi:hypothetical protein
VPAQSFEYIYHSMVADAMLSESVYRGVKMSHGGSAGVCKNFYEIGNSLD